MKKIIYSNKFWIFSIFLTTFALATLAYLFSGNRYITFSDSAKFADVARSISLGSGYHSGFKFFTWISLDSLKTEMLDKSGILPAYTLAIALMFKIFGVSDVSLVLTSSLFFALSSVVVYLLSSNLFGKKVGVLSAIAVTFDKNLIDYATSGASETFFIFLILATFYVFLTNTSNIKYLGFVGLALIYLTKFQAAIYIIPLLLLFFVKNFEFKKATLYFFALSLVVFICDKVFFYYIKEPGFLYSITSQTKSAVLTYSSGSDSSSNFLRGGVMTLNLQSVIKKALYNLYNFYKLLPNIINPYLFGFFVIALFQNIKNAKEKLFKIFSVIMVLLTFFVTSLSIPFFRYIHPIIPLVYILGVAGIVWSFREVTESYKKVLPKILLQISIVVVVLFFSVGQTVGILMLDSRFESKIYNHGKPPVYAKLSWNLRENTSKDDIVVTNLDTWGTWYGERLTVWFPVMPKMLIDEKSGSIPFDAIYLTSYKIDDENYFMNEEWRSILQNPYDSKKWRCDGCDLISKQFTVKNVYSIAADENYENLESQSVLLVKRSVAK